MKLDRYETNLRVHGKYIYSFDTKVAIIHDNHIEELGYWSMSTIKHVNYAGAYFGKPIKRYKK